MLRRRGVRVPASNRLSRASDVLERMLAAHEHGDLRNALALESRATHAIHSIYEALLVACALTRERRNDPFPNENLRHLLLGADAPGGERRTAPRDISFELVVGALLVLTGLDALPEEPDYRTTYFGETIGIPAKRINSTAPGAVQALIDKAVEQLERAQLRGYVALSVDRLVDTLGEGTPDVVGAQFNALVQSVQRGMSKHGRATRLLGAMLLGRHVSFTGPPEARQFRLQTPLQILAFADPVEEGIRAFRFQRMFRDRYFRAGREVAALLDGG